MNEVTTTYEKELLKFKNRFDNYPEYAELVINEAVDNYYQMFRKMEEKKIKYFIKNVGGNPPLKTWDAEAFFQFLTEDSLNILWQKYKKGNYVLKNLKEKDDDFYGTLIDCPF